MLDLLAIQFYVMVEIAQILRFALVMVHARYQIYALAQAPGQDTIVSFQFVMESTQLHLLYAII